MIQPFVDKFMANKEELCKRFATKHPENYLEIVRAVVETITIDKYGYEIDSRTIREIDYGEYQGTLVYVITDSDWCPSNIWCVMVFYGSCSGCDTLQGISMYDDGPPTPEQVTAYWTLALHIVQGLKQMGDTE